MQGCMKRQPALLLMLTLASCTPDSSDPLDSSGMDDQSLKECFNFDLECDDGQVCKPVDQRENRHACLPAEAEGYCDDSSDCGPDGYCVGETSYLNLFDWTEETAGTCHSLSGEGAPCFNFNFECRGDLVCAPANPSESFQTCRPPSAEEAPCDDDADCDPDNGWYCLHESVGAAGECGLLKNSEDPCLFDWTCSDGLSCIPSDADPDQTFCNPPGQAGDYCDTDSDCVLPLECNYTGRDNRWKCG